MEDQSLLSEEIITNKIYLIRGQKVMLDRDLALLYGIETKVLKQSVKRNILRFPEDFMFELIKIEFENWRSQFWTLKSQIFFIYLGFINNCVNKNLIINKAELTKL